MTELHIDWTACDARGLCAELLPELVSTDPWGYPLIADETVPARLEEHARRAARLCPRLAISLRDREISPPAPEARPHRTQWTPAGRPAPRG
ncbi:ferredoxin [Kutzneria sp. NPDC052558]|uniref:ferredoxin n=1 Tax=Kutzneria sp. NPDC052558 TaxID=3364121 RepID=UPI0037CA442C